MMTPNESTASGASRSAEAASAPVDPASIQTAPSPSSSAIQTETLPAGSDRVALPPITPEQRAVVEAVRKEQTELWLDCALVMLVLALAFLSALFPIHNSDFLMHLGTGKLLSEGKYTFGDDPFSVNSLGARWVNHAWLYDVVSYWTFLAVGGTGLSILKAVLVTALAVVLLMIRRPGQSIWIPALCTGLAILALSPRLLMQPTVWSFLFLALTLWVLTLRDDKRRGKDAAEESSLLTRFANWPYRLYVLPVLFAIWVNVDSWFVLGPITVALYWLGEALQEAFAPVPSGPDAPRPGERKHLLLVLGIGLAACLLNPFHVHAFAVPAELSPVIAEEIKNDPGFRRMFLSPWSSGYLRKDLLYNVAEMAYFPFLALGLASFGLNLAGWRWWRALVWLAFALLGAYHARSIPFFAVVGGPIMALNFQDLMIRRFQARRAEPKMLSIWSLSGRAATVLLLVIAVAAAWPGWLHGFPGEKRAEGWRVGWGLDIDPALVETAERLAQWRRDGKIIGEQNAFNFHPDVANYLALYCPEEKSFFDYRLPLFRNSVTTYLKLRNDFRPGGGNADWRTVFRERNVKHMIVYYDQDPIHVLPAIERLEEDKYLPEKERQWTLIDQRGRVALYAWSDPAQGRDEAVRALEIRPDQRAFGPSPETAPGKRSGEGPQGRDSLWAQYTRPAGKPTADSYEAWFHYLMSHVEAQQAAREAATDYARLIATAIGFGAAPQIMPDYPMRAAQYGLAGKFHSPASALLAIRAARRALATNPEDDFAYRFLGFSYQLLPENAIGDIRKCQIAGALYNAVKLTPERADIHERLWKFYSAQNIHDLAVKHLKEYVRLTEEAGSWPGERAEDYRDRLRGIRDDAKKWDERIKQAQNQFLIASKPFTNVLAKVELAQKRGLTGEALDLLLKAKPEELGAGGQAKELFFLLQVGRVEEWPDDLRDPGADTTLAWLMVMRAATVGDYDEADELLAKLIPVTRERYLASLPPVVAVQAAPLWMDMLDGTGMRPIGWGISQRLLNMQRLQVLQRFTPAPAEEGELSVIRGILALEAGKNEHALNQFRYALNVSFPPSRYVPYLGVLGTSCPLEAAASFIASGEMAIGPMANVPSLRWALEYARLLEQAARKKP